METEMNTLYLLPVVSLYVNDNDAMIPEVWANMGLAILEENMVMAALVHRDFSPEVASFGDVVNTRRPGQFKLRRKGDNDNVLNQDANTTNVQVPLNQHFYTTFTIKDGEASKSFQDLVDIHLLPGMQNIARGIDRALLGRAHDYLGNTAGKLDGLTGANSYDTLLECRQVLNENKAFFNGRHLVVSPASETSLLKSDIFVKANEKGDDGTALREASLGRVLGFDTWMDQNVPSPRRVASDVSSGEVTSAAAVAGATTISVVGSSMTAGDWIVADDDGQPNRVVSYVDPTVTLESPLKNDVASGSAVYVYNEIDAKGAQVAGETKRILVDQYTKVPQVGQILTIGTGASRRDYIIIETEAGPSSDTYVLLDRPLEFALADDEAIKLGPGGSMNMAFHREALALVNRPLALPASDMGVRSMVASHNDISMRVTMQYDWEQQGTVVTLDLLCGTAVLDTDLACILLG
jgi:hypothetical protein